MFLDTDGLVRCGKSARGTFCGRYAGKRRGPYVYVIPGGGYAMMVAALLGIALAVPAQGFDHRAVPAPADRGDYPIVIATPSAIATRVWVPVPVPYQEAVQLPEVAWFQTGRDETTTVAVRGPRVGYQTIFYDVLCNLAAGGVITGQLVPSLADDSGRPEQAPPMQVSAWVADDIGRLIPRVTLREGGRTHVTPPPDLELQFSSPARQTWASTSRCGPLVVHFWCTLWSDQDVAEWQLFVVHSDPTSPAMQVTASSLQVEFGEPPVVDDAVPLGIGAPFYNAESDRWSFDLIGGGPVDIGNAQGLPIIRGALLCTDSSKRWWHNLLSADRAIRARVDRLLSRGTGAPVAGNVWDGEWLAFRASVPAGTRDRDEIDARIATLRGPMLEAQDLFAQRGRGLFKFTGSTGDQPDFGASKGAELTLGDLRAGLTWHYHSGQALRPMHYREASGAPVRKADHPQWWTWSQTTHFNQGVSPDRLGKPYPEPLFNTHGYSGTDDQHASSNDLASCAAAFDWPAHRMLVDDEIRVAEANTRFQSGVSGAARAIGRRMLCDANRWILTGRESVWTGLVLEHAKLAFHDAFVPFEGFRLLGPPFRDARVMVDPETGVPVDTIVLWQEGLGLNGLVAGWAAHRYRERIGLDTYPNVELLRRQIVGMATTFARYFVQGPDGWQTWGNVRWTSAFPEPSVLEGTDDVPGLRRDRITVQSGWFPWTAAGLYYLARADHGIELPGEVAETLRGIADEWDAEVAPTASLELREWMAVVQR